MPTAYPDSIAQRGYVQKETAWGTINHDGGNLATLAGTDAFLFTDLEMNDAIEITERPDKTGDYSALAGTAGRRNGTWRMRCSLPGVAAVGDAPDVGPFIEALLGSGTTHAATDYEYKPADVNAGLTIWDFNALATGTQRCAVGAIVQKCTVTWGETYGYLEFSGECKHVLDTAQFTTASATAKSGITAFPSEPVTPVVTGDANPGYMGVITIDSNTYTAIRSGSIEIAVARSLQKAAWNETFPTGPMAGRRTVSVTISMDDDDSANLTSLKVHGYDGGKITASIQIGSVAKNISLFALKEILVPQPTYDYSQQRRGITFSGMRSCQSALKALDEISWKFK